jgi:hypothetical protein
MKLQFLLLMPVVCSLAFAADSHETTTSGQWVLTQTDQAGKVQFGLSGGSGERRNHFNMSNEWDLADLQGLDSNTKARHDVQFTVTRDAGVIRCRGFAEDGEGAGLFRFEPNKEYAGRLSSLGFPGVEEDDLLPYAVHDVSFRFVQEMTGAPVRGLDKGKLLSFRIFGVSRKFIDELRAAGLPAIEADKLIAFRIHGVSPELVQTLKSEGYQPDEDKLIAMRIHGVTPEYMRSLDSLGYKHVDLDRLIAFRIHGVSADFIERVEKLGYSHPEPEQLIAMRIHGVTPEYIASMREHGLKDLSIDKLISLRIQGIN